MDQIKSKPKQKIAASNRLNTQVAKWFKRELDRALDKGEPTRGLEDLLIQNQELIVKSNDYELHLYLLLYLFDFHKNVSKESFIRLSSPFINNEYSNVSLSANLNLLLIEENAKSIKSVLSTSILNLIDSVRNWELFCNYLKINPELTKKISHIPYSTFDGIAKKLLMNIPTAMF
jgi:hypothetical protein